MAREGKIDPVIGRRRKEIRRVIRNSLETHEEQPRLALRIVNADVPANLAACKLLSLDVGALVAGSKYRGEFEERMKGVLKEIEDSAEMIVLFVDEIHLLMGAGSSGEGGMDAANLLKPMLARGQLHCIGATTLGEYRKYIEKDQAFERRFPASPGQGAVHSRDRLYPSWLEGERRLPDSAVDLIDEAAAAVRVTRESQPEALDNLERKLRQLQIEIHALEREKDEAAQARLREAKAEAANVEEELKPLREKYESEKERGREIQEAKIKLDQLKVKRAEAERVGDLSTASDLQYYAIPDVEQRIAKLEQAKAKADAEMYKSDDGGQSLLTDSVGPEQIQEIVARWTGIPVTRLKTTEKEKLLNMEKHLGHVVVGQKEAVTSVANAIRLQRSGLAKPEPTAQLPLLRSLRYRQDAADQGPRRVPLRRLQGDDPLRHLTEALRRRPFSILLFDEVEKAAKEVLTVLLQLMDDGRITDGQGRIIDARNSIVVMTSNLGAEYLARPNAPDGRIDPTTKEMVMGALRNYFLPEFLNRISSIVIFNRLTKREIRKIVDLRVSEIQKRLAQNGRNVTINMSVEVRDYLGSAGYSPAYGARPLARLIEKEVLNRLAVLILRGAVRDGETANVVLENGHIMVLPNHGDSEVDTDDEDMYDEEDAVQELADDGGMDLYDD
ncbi:Chaperonin ClpA/B [Botryosphaeria dothidea]|uniref:Chaperonin ClpA/B n=1 Tax=Botryosphaeria dothidea TaxID=55169 RepID=A0A8H4N065_9PEZI|nr:Chaperonin ClpA/B [Botryosphaeria dothidea]